MTPKEIVDMIGEKKAKQLGILIDQLKTKDLNYTITITGDNDTEDKMAYTQNVNTFLEMLQKIEVLKQGTVPINFDVMVQSLVNKFNLPDGTYVEPQEGKTGGKVTLQQEIEVAAKSAGMDPQAYLTMLAQKAGKTPEQMTQEIQQAGSLEAWMKAMAAAEQGGTPAAGGAA
jgi:hypothetical protein